MMRISIGILTFFVSLQATALSIDSIVDLVKSKQINNKIDFVSALPEACKTYYSLAFESRATHCSSFENPRIVMSCKKQGANIFVTVEGEPPVSSQSGPLQSGDCQRIDILEDVRGDVKSLEIAFHESASEPHTITLDPPRCRACHGVPLKYLGNSSPHWAGFYQSIDGKIYNDSKEDEGFAAFKKAAPLSALYSQFTLPIERPIPEGLSFVLPETDITPNHHFFNRLGELHMENVGVTLAKHPEFPRFANVLAGAALGCESLASFLPPDFQFGMTLQTHQSSIRTKYVQSEMLVLEKIARTNGVGFGLSEPKHLPHIAAIYYVAERMGLDLHYLSASLDRRRLSFPGGSFYPVNRLLFGEATVPLGDKLSELRTFLKDQASHIEFSPPWGYVADPLLCEELKTRSILDFANQPDVELPNLAIEHPDSASNPFAKCTQCHSTKMHTLLSAPMIPFEKGPVFLKSWLKANSALIPKIEHRIMDPGDLRMPPNESLTENETLGILDFLSGVRS